MKPTARRADLDEQWVDDELVVYDLRTQQAHCLNPVMATVRALADGTRSVDEVLEVARQDHPTLDSNGVWEALDALASANLLEERAVPSMLGNRTVSRRAMVRKTAAASAALLAVPAIATILTPRPAQAQSSVEDPCHPSDPNTPPAPDCGTEL